jgi:hypothetical protein
MAAGSVANVACNLRRPHPLGPGPATDYDLTVLLGLPIILGSVAGAMLNKASAPASVGAVVGGARRSVAQRHGLAFWHVAPLWEW